MTFYFFNWSFELENLKKKHDRPLRHSPSPQDQGSANLCQFISKPKSVLRPPQKKISFFFTRRINPTIYCSSRYVMHTMTHVKIFSSRVMWERIPFIFFSGFCFWFSVFFSPRWTPLPNFSLSLSLSLPFSVIFFFKIIKINYLCLFFLTDERDR